MQIRATYEEATARKFPEPVVIAIAKDPAGKYNPITLGWMTFTSVEPPMMAIAVALKQHTNQAIRHSREFVLSLPAVEMADDTLYFGTVSGRDEDKLAARGTKTQRAEEIDCVLLSDAVASFECVLETELVTGDHSLFVGRVVAAHMNEDPSVRRLFNLGSGHRLEGLPEG